MCQSLGDSFEMTDRNKDAFQYDAYRLPGVCLEGVYLERLLPGALAVGNYCDLHLLTTSLADSNIGASTIYTKCEIRCDRCDKNILIRKRQYIL